MLQGAAYCSRPVYGHSHYKKFWLKKMETEDEQARFLPPEPDPPESFGRGIFWKGESSHDVSLLSKEKNLSPLEIKSNGRSSNGVSSLRSRRQEFSTIEDEGREGIFDCALSIGMQTPSEEQREGEQKYETQSFVQNLQNENDGKKSNGLYKLRIHSLKRLLHSDGDSQIGAQKMTEIEFCEGTVSRTCSDCKTSRTPLWRNGPNGPKSLCNACGIRYKKIGKRSIGNGNGDRQKSPPKFSSSVHRLTKINKRKQHNNPDYLASPPDPYDCYPPRKRSAAASSSSSAEIVARHDPMLNGTVARHDPMLNGTVARHDPFLNGGVAQENPNCGGHVRMRSFAKDEEEGAVLLMGLSCGLVNA